MSRVVAHIGVRCYTQKSFDPHSTLRSSPLSPASAPAPVEAERPAAPLTVATTVTLYPTGDTYADQDHPNTTYYTSTWLRVARAGEFLVLRRSYLRFDLSSIPDDAVVTSGMPPLVKK
jgi:hypothetical protein